jgi:uncharacterized RDD family membrane protein YckC
MAYYVPQTSLRVKGFLIDQLLKMMMIAPFWQVASDTAQAGQLFFSWAQFLLFTVVYLGYDILSLWFFQKTPGQWVMGLQTISEIRSTEPLMMNQVLIRVCVKQLNLFFSYAPDILMLFRYDRRTLADLFAETRVVSEVPRVERSKSRWIIASFAIVYFCFLGWSQALQTFRDVHVGQRGVSLPGVSPDEFSWNFDENFSMEDLAEDVESE